MTALIALQNEKTVQSIVDILNAMGMEARICREYDEFVECLKEKPEIVVSEPSIQDNSVLELIAEKPWSRWIIQDHFSWAAADFLCSQVGCYDILMDITGDSNIYEVLSSPYKSLNSSGNAGNIAHYRWIRADSFYPATSEPVGLHDILGETNGADRLGNDFCSCIHNRFFTFSNNGYLEQTHFSAILKHLFDEKLTGTLHLWRRSMHWSIAFQDGLPFDMMTSDELGYFTVTSWAKRQEEFKDVFKSETDSTHKSLHATPQAPQILKSWITSLMSEIFSWPYGDYLWCPDELPEKDDIFPEISRENILNTLIYGIFYHTPMVFIVEVTQSLLPYFLKLKDNIEWFETALPESARAVVEKLRKGITISELLATMPDDSPVHQVVYFLILMEKLDLKA